MEADTPVVISSLHFGHSIREWMTFRRPRERNSDLLLFSTIVDSLGPLRVSYRMLTRHAGQQPRRSPCRYEVRVRAAHNQAPTDRSDDRQPRFRATETASPMRSIRLITEEQRPSATSSVRCTFCYRCRRSSVLF